MPLLSLSHLTDHALERDAKAVFSRERQMTAEGLSYLLEIDTRKRYLRAGYKSMLLYCQREMLLSENRALKRLQAARAARECPALVDVLADGRVHLSGLVLLSPHLTPANVDELLLLSTHKSKAEIRTLLAQRLRQPELPSAGLSDPLLAEPAAELVVAPAPGQVENASISVEPAMTSALSHAPGHVNPPSIRITVRGRSLDLFRRAQALLGDEVRSDHPDDIERKVLELAVAALEKRTLAIARRAKPSRGASKGRGIPKAVRREVWERDGGQCTFTSDAGVRCTARSGLQFDHIVPVARGGETTVENLRVLCRAHNQYEAERTFGAGFMAQKHDEAKAAAERAKCDEVIPWLRQLGFRLADAKRGAAMCAEVADASLEVRVKHAAAGLGRERFGRLTQRPSQSVT